MTIVLLMPVPRAHLPVRGDRAPLLPKLVHVDRATVVGPAGELRGEVGLEGALLDLEAVREQQALAAFVAALLGTQANPPAVKIDAPPGVTVQVVR